jgi:hypothetical protein
MSVPGDLLTNTANAQTAYDDALKAARNASNSLFRSYGYTAPDSGGNYSIEGAQGAFNPMELFKNAQGGVDLDKVKSMASGLQIGGTGKLASILNAGASGVSESDIGMAQRGFNATGQDGAVTGGLVAQQRQLAQSKAAGNLEAGKEEFLTGMAQALSPVGQASSNYKQAQFQDQIANRETAAGNQVWSGFNAILEQLGNKPEGSSSLSTIGAGKGEGSLSKTISGILASGKIGPVAKKNQIAALKTQYNLTPQQASFIDAQLAKMK